MGLGYRPAMHNKQAALSVSPVMHDVHLGMSQDATRQPDCTC
jgi:hypothetical protein